MKIESHIRLIKESMSLIKNLLDKDIRNYQRTIGFNCSVVAIDLLEVYFHSKNLIDPGMAIKHNFFNSEKMAKRYLPFDFENKKEIIAILVKIEKKRHDLWQRPNKRKH